MDCAVSLATPLADAPQTVPQSSRSLDFIEGLPDSFYEAYKTRRPPWKSTYAYAAYRRTYSRKITERRGEEWWETCKRVHTAIIKMGARFTQAEAERLYDHFFHMRCNFGGRGLWQLGTETVARIGGSSLNNCWGVACDSPTAFVFAFDQLMLGGGVGFNIQREYVYKLPKVLAGVKIERKDGNEGDVDHFIVPDMREGWVRLLEKLLHSFFVSGKGFTYSLHCLRSKGAQIKGFGGTASGPDILEDGIVDICKVLKNRAGRNLRPIDCLDIMCIIGRTVKAGNVRRSALIAIGDPDDRDYLRAKRWSSGKVPGWRENVNVSVACSDLSELDSEYWENYEIDPKTGEAKGEAYGLFNLELARTKGRIHDPDMPDPGVAVVNPCGEIPLEIIPGTGQGEPCNLGEIALTNIESKAVFLDIVRLMTRCLKTVASVDYHWPETNRIVHKNMRLGLGLTGFVQALKKLGREQTAEWCDEGYAATLDEDQWYSRLMGFPLSIRHTTMKPSGTLSSVFHCSPGANAAYAKHYIRRMQIGADNPLVGLLQAAGYRVIRRRNSLDNEIDANTVVVEFPVHLDEAIYAAELSAIDQLEIVKFLYEHWVDNSVSVTVYYRDGELPALRKWLEENFRTSLKTVSFCLHSGHGFVQAPYEEITEAQYIEESARVSEVFWVAGDTSEKSADESGECAGGFCPTR